MNKFLKTTSPQSIFVIGLIVLVLFMLIQFPFADESGRGASVTSQLHNFSEDTFMDFFNSVYDAGYSDNPYRDRGVIYPPLTYLFYKICGKFFPGDMASPQMRSSQMGLLLITVLTVISIVILHHIFVPVEERNTSKSKLTWLILLGTVPFWYVIERGNLVLQSLVFLAYYVKNYQSSVPWKKEVALICLAISAAIKIYPAIFGVLLLMNKQYRDAIRCVLYGIIFFLLPFAFFGGIRTFPVMVYNILNTGARMSNLGWGYKLNIDNTLGFLSAMLHVQILSSNTLKVIACVSLLSVLFLSRKSWQKLMALSSAMILFPSFSFTYTMIFAFIPLMDFFDSEPENTTMNFLFSALFLGMFAPFSWGGYNPFHSIPSDSYSLNLTTVISSVSILAMMFLMLADTLRAFWLKNFCAQ